MPSVVIVSGCPGAGKTTLAAALAHARPNGLHLPSDPFYDFPAHPIDPTTPESHRQNEAIVSALGRAAAAFLERDYFVVLDGIVGPWFLPRLRSEFPASTEVSYVVLRVPEAVALARVRQRRDDSPIERVVPTVRAFADLGELERHVIETEHLAADALAEAVEDAIASGRLLLRG